jgi:enoyl-CoA hydratase/carnithine racemase
MQTLDAHKALELGLVAEVLPPDTLLARMWELAEHLARRSTLLLHYTGLLLTEALRRQMHDLLAIGSAWEMLAPSEQPQALGSPTSVRERRRWCAKGAPGWRHAGKICAARQATLEVRPAGG